MSLHRAVAQLYELRVRPEIIQARIKSVDDRERTLLLELFRDPFQGLAALAERLINQRDVDRQRAVWLLAVYLFQFVDSPERIVFSSGQRRDAPVFFQHVR